MSRVGVGDMKKAVYDPDKDGRIEKDALEVTLNKLLLGAGAASDPTEIDIPSSGITVVTMISVTDKSTGTIDTWVDVDCSGEIPAGAKAAMGYVSAGACGSGESGGVRKNGAGDEGTYSNIAVGSMCFFVVELDAGRVFEQKISHTCVDLFITGYIA